MKRIIVVGKGEIGEPFFNLLSHCEDYDVHSYDLVDEKGPVGHYGIMHICFPYGPNFEKDVIKYEAQFTPNLTIINSTVSPGTTRNISKNMQGQICHSPVLGRVADGLDWALKAYRKFIGPVTPEAGSSAKEHFEHVGLETVVCNSPETTEWAKLLETSYWGVLLAWHQEIERISHEFDLDTRAILNFFSEVERGSRGKIPRPVLYVGNIGGHCIVNNARLLLSKYESNLVADVLRSQLAFEASMKSVVNMGDEEGCVLCGRVYSRRIIRNLVGDPFFVIQCLTCREPMFVFRAHREPTKKEFLHAKAVAKQFYPDCKIDAVRCSIPDHPHFHVRKK